MDLIDIFIFIITTIGSAFFIISGSLILRKYFIYKYPSLFYISTCFLLITLCWDVYVINFTVYLISGSELPPQVFFIIGFSTIWIATTFWMIGMFTVIYKHLLKLITSIYLIMSVIFTILFFTFILTDMNLIGSLDGFWRIEYGPFLVVVVTIALLSQFISILAFFWDSKSSKDLENRLKAKFFILMESFFVIGISIEILPYLIPAFAFLSRPLRAISPFLVAISAFFLYLATVMPDWVKKRFIKN